MKIIEARGARIPAVGLGTYTLEGDTCTNLVARAIEKGYRHIDTARMYGNEREVGQGIRDSGIDPQDLFVVTKIWRDQLAAAALRESAERAVESIGIGPVDAILIHWPNAEIALEETILALNGVREAGLCRQIGVANFPSALFDEASALSDAPLICNQVEFHPLLSQDAVHASCRRHGAAMIAYSPLGQGGALLSDPTIASLAERHDCSTAAIVLRWEIQKDGVGAIPRTSKPDRLEENLSLFDFELEPEEMEALDLLSRKRERLVDPSFAPVWDAL